MLPHFLKGKCPHVLLQSVYGKCMYHGRECSSFHRDHYRDLYGKNYTVGHDTYVFNILTVVGHEVYTHPKSDYHSNIVSPGGIVSLL